MVKKLYKYEFASLARILLPINLTVVAISALGRILMAFESDSIAYRMLRGSFIFAIIASFIVSAILTTILCIVRFYKNLFGAEGYLSHTLPVSPGQHIFVKLTTAVLFYFLNTISILGALAILTSGEFLVEILHAMAYLLDQFLILLPVHGVAYLIEIAILEVVTILYGMLLYYVCIAIGQRSKKNRILKAVAAYYLYYLITQTLATAVIIIVTMLGIAEIINFEMIYTWIADHSYLTVHLSLWFNILLYATLSVVGFSFTKNTLKYKLNLE